MLKVNFNESKNSKRSIIDELDNYNFRERVSYLEENLQYDNVGSIASETNYENSPERQLSECNENLQKNKEIDENKQNMNESQVN